MNRREELEKILNDANNSFVSPLIDEIMYMEDQLNILRPLPKIRVNPADNSQQKITPAWKMYKECVQQYLNAVKLLSGVTKTDIDTEESPLRQWVNKKIGGV